MKTLGDYQNWMKALQDSALEKYSIKSNPSLEEVFKEPRLVIVITHATALSWIPIVSVLTNEACQNGGADRIPRSIVDRWFYSNPFTQKVAAYITQSETPQNFEQILESFLSIERTDVVLFPEGAHSFFGNPSELQEFRSDRYLELAVRAGCPILLCAHQGSEHWSLPVQIPAGFSSLLTLLAPFAPFFTEALNKKGHINLPIPQKKIADFRVACELYHPVLKANQLATEDSARKTQLAEESQKVRTRLIELLNELLSDKPDTKDVTP